MKDRGGGVLSLKERQRIRAAREAKGLSMRALSKQLNYNRSAVEMLENGGRSPSLYFLRDLYRALDLDDYGLFDD
jgi:transcriptional regulator with XRE-family HTH domain